MTKDDLIVKFITKNITIYELDELSTWVLKPKNEKIFKEFIKTNYAIDYNMAQFKTEKTKALVLSRINKSTKKKVINSAYFYKYAAMVAFFISLTISLVWYINSSINEKEDIEVLLNPGTDKAILTLANGNRIVLEKGKNKTLKNIISSSGKIVYEKETLNKNTANSEIKYNYLTIPRGGQYYIELSDGTKVWMNSESKLKYPISFVRNQRREVELLYGEAYFDVSKSSNHNGALFNVKTKTQDITVLGTEFNIKAYQDEQFVYSTLLEGKIEVSNGIVNKKLVPGEQSIIGLYNEKIEIKKVDVVDEIAWKNGFFSFEKETLQQMLLTLSRWYNTEITYEDESKKKLIFSGVLKRTNNIQELLLNIQKTGKVKFIIKNKEIMVR